MTEHFARFQNFGPRGWCVTVVERDDNDDVREVAQGWTIDGAETRGTLDVLADLGWERVGSSPVPITGGGVGSYAQSVRPRQAVPMSAPTAEALAGLMLADASARGMLGVPHMHDDDERRDVAFDTFADLALSASVNDTTDLTGLPVFIVATDLVRLLADFAELVAHDDAVWNDRAELEERAVSIAAARGYVPPAGVIGTVSA